MDHEKNIPRRGSPDFILLFLTFVLVCFGIAMVFSASSMTTSFTRDDPWFFTKKQIISVIIGASCMLIVMNISYMKLKKLVFPGFLVVLFLLILILFTGEQTNGAKSWFYIGNFGLQPSEFAKLNLVLLLASIISNKNEKFRELLTGIFPALVVTFIVCMLIIAQPDLGSAIVVFFSAVVIIVIGGSKIKHLLLLLAGLVIFIFAVYFYFKFTGATIENDYRLQRMVTFMNPWDNQFDSGYQLVQSLLAFGHGGITGAGFGQGVQKLHYLPEAHNDFIFAIVGEELGFIGVIIFVITYLLMIWRGIIVSLRSQHMFGMLAGTGIMVMIACQALINIGGVTSTLPLTGVTLPLISYGGTSMMVSLIAIGLVLSISRDQHIHDNNKSTET